MYKFLLVFVSVMIVGCGPMMTKLPNYTEPELGSVAEIQARGKLKGIGLNKTHLEIFTGCFSGRDYAKENVLGKMYFKKEEFDKKIVSVPAGDRLYFKYGTDSGGWICHSQFSFVPIEGNRYLFDYDMRFGGCNINVTNLTTNAPFEMKTYKKTSMESLGGVTAIEWRQCKNLDVEN